jgi:translation initiation factor IF-3
MSTYRANQIAEDSGYDLVEVSPKANPPVCKIMDFGKFKYERAKQERAKRQNATQISVKEVKFRPKTDIHDFNYKIKNIRKFIEHGDKVRIVVVFKGREIVHPNIGFDLLEKILEELREESEIEQRPTREGRAVSMLLGPPNIRKQKKNEVKKIEVKKNDVKKKKVTKEPIVEHKSEKPKNDSDKG